MDYLRGISKTFCLLLSNTSAAVVGNDFLCLKLRFYKVIPTAMFSSVIIYKVLPARRHQPIDSQLLKNNLEALHITLQQRKWRRGLEIWVTMQKFFPNVRIQAWSFLYQVEFHMASICVALVPKAILLFIQIAMADPWRQS